jgi:UDP-glucose 4-epimerase
MSKILLTGGLGYIGSHTAVALIQNGYEVILIDNLSNSQKFIIENIQKITNQAIQFYELDLCDGVGLDKLFADNPSIDSVIHLAAYKYANESMLNPLKYYHNNLLSTINLLQAVQKYKIKSLVFSSSCTVYGEPEVIPVTEQTPIIPAKSVYGRTKQMCEDFIQDTARVSQGLNVALLRYFNPIGAHESGLLGELPLGEPNNLMPYITQTAIGKRAMLKVFGGDYDTPDGTCLRDFLHITDLATAHSLALNRLLEKQNTAQVEAFNIATGTPYSVLEVIKSFEKVAGLQLNYQIAPRREGDVSKIYADCTKANTVLKWKAEKTLDEMTASAWRWEQYIQGIQ